MNKKDIKLDGAMFILKTVVRNNGGDVDQAIKSIMRWSPYSNRAKLEEAAKIIKSSSLDKVKTHKPNKKKAEKENNNRINSKVVT